MDRLPAIRSNVGLDLRRTPPTVVEGRIVVHPAHHVSPLDADEHGVYPTVLRGGPVSNLESNRPRKTRRRTRGWRRALRLRGGRR